jgi:hypothetical protein
MRRGKYWVYDPSGNGIERQEPLMLSLRKPKGEQGCIWAKINEGDIIKFGKCKYLVKEIINRSIPMLNTSQNINIEISHNQSNDSAIQSFNYTELRSKSERSGISCRICLNDKNDVSNPVIPSPCECSGSVKYIHKKCLQQWLKSKVSERTTRFCSSYSWKELECNVCKKKYPSILN